MERPLALVVDGDPAVRAAIREVFRQHDIEVLGAASTTEAGATLRTRPVSFLLVDTATPGVDASEAIRFGSGLQPEPISIAIVSAAENPARALDFVATGAFDVLWKPVDGPQLQQVAYKLLRHHALAEEVRRLRRDLRSREGYDGLVGKSAPMERLRERIRVLAETGGPVWLAGEPGSGREFAARTIHARSGRGDTEFRILDCAVATPQAWDAVLAPGPGGVEAGALYADTFPALAADLQRGLISALGSGACRLFCASTRTPSAEAEQGRLPADLVGALGARTLELPPLRDRPGDVPLLARHFIESIRAINHLPPIRPTAEAVEALERYRWPGNVQELRGAIEHAVILAEDGRILPRHLPEKIQRATEAWSPPPQSRAGRSSRRFREAKREVVESFERAYLLELMQRFGGNVTGGAQQAGMLRSALQRLLRKYGLKSAEFRGSRQGAGAEDASRAEG
jgi:two-component system response regulator HydG